jgi:hypothetical protein
MQESAYASFAECRVLGREKSWLPDFMRLLKKTVEKYPTVILADKHVIACPNFRLAFRSPEYGNYLRALIEERRICAAMFEGIWKPDGGNAHLTFDHFQTWYIHYKLWGTPPELYMKGDRVLREELSFFDGMEKIFTESKNRDSLYVKMLLADLDNPILVRQFRPYHEKFKEIAFSVYDDGVHEGIIRVEEYELAPDNISARFRKFLIQEKVPENRVTDALRLIYDFSRSTLTRIEPALAGGTPVFSDFQDVWQKIIANASGIASAPEFHPRASAGSEPLL